MYQEVTFTAASTSRSLPLSTRVTEVLANAAEFTDTLFYDDPYSAQEGKECKKSGGK
jgi:hypothetical protein